MNAAGIICEFDPFHKGHKYLLDTVRAELKPDAVVCVMSGDFTQRGMPAFWNKFDRASAAVACGADLVLELPVFYALNSADQFAKGGVRILNGLGCVRHIAFGSELGDADILFKYAQAMALESQDFSECVREALSNGLSYPAALSKGFREVYPDLKENILESPNDTLAVCYLKEIILQNADIKPYAVKRIGQGHGSSDNPENNAASGTFIRNLISNGFGAADSYLPEESADILLNNSNAGFDEQKLFDLLRYRILTTPTAELSKAPEVSEGLENRMIKAAQEASCLDDLIDGIKSKRYTRARICRALMQILLGIDREKVSLCDNNLTKYAKVLAFNHTGAKILKCVQKMSDMPVLSNINKNTEQGAAYNDMLNADILSNDIYSILKGNTVSKKSDRVLVPIINKI